MACCKALVFVLCVAGMLAGSGCGKYADPVAEQDLLTRLGQTSITVFPAYVRGGREVGYDPAAAAEIAEFLRAERLAEVSISQDRVAITGHWGVNQSRMFRASSDAFASHLRANPIHTQYALLPEYLVYGDGKVGGVHCYILRSDGVRAFGVGLNSHHKHFSDASPRSAQDCTGLLIRELRERFKTDS